MAYKSKERSCTIYQSEYEAIFVDSDLSKRAANALMGFIVRYLFADDGEVPDPKELPKDARAVWVGMKHRLERSRSVSRAKREASDASAESLPERYEAATPSLQERYEAATPSLQSRYTPSSDGVGDSVEEHQNGGLPAETQPAPTDVPADERTESMGLGMGMGMGLGMGQHNVPFSGENARDFLRLKELGFDHKCDAVCDALGEESCHFENAISDWVDRWHNKGWVDFSGDDMDEIVRDGSSGEAMPRWLCMARGYYKGLVERSGHDEWGLEDEDYEW